ncbi:MAG TPA: DUF5615 family PIN-like protein [Bryobacteraceae bacterium]|nr:DUF5615 family PIN-like protein [Bryobacteraceae bacterium]
MSIRFLADADFNEMIVKGVLRREPSVDFSTVQAAGVRHLPDPDILAFAASEDRIVISHDVNTMPSHFADFRAAGNHSPGLFMISQSVDVGTAIEELLLIWAASEASEWEGQLAWLPL